MGYPGYNCMSKNAVVIHGIGTEHETFNPGDKLTFDVGVEYEGFICDSAFTICAAPVAQELQDLCLVTRKAIDVACTVIKPNNRIGDISHAVQTYVESHNYQLLRDYGGHGCGVAIHEGPFILNYGKPNTGPTLKPGMVLCIEPMVLQKNHEAYLAKDK